MDAGLATVLAAAVATFGAIIITIIQIRGFRQENKDDHAVVQKRLDNLIDMVGKQGARMTSHLDWHLDKKQTENPQK
jgi:hypothetical protein